MDSQELGSAPNSENKAPSTTSTIVAVVPSNDTENAMTILTRNLNGIPTVETAESQEIIDASDLTRDQWIQVLSASSVLKAWKRRSEGDTIHVNRAPCAALSLKSRSPDDHEGSQGLPEFEIADDTYVDSRESKSRLERELTLKAFSENGIRAGLSVGAPDIGFGLSGAVSWQKEGSHLDQQQTSNRAIHGFYNFPRVILHLDPDYLDLSPQCKQFLKRYGQDCLDPNKISHIYKTFTERFGSILPARVTLGARLCTTQELNTDNISNISEARKTLETDLTTKVTAASAGIQSGYHRKTGSSAVGKLNQTAESSRMTLETQGGNGLLASSIPDWTASVASHRYWRTIQQENYWDLPTFLRELTQDRTTREYFDAFANHAMAEKNKPEKLRIEATARIRVKEGNNEFVIGLCISLPEAIKTITCRQAIMQKDRYLPLGMILGFTTQKLQRRMSSIITVDSLDWPKNRDETIDFEIEVELQPFMHRFPTPTRSMVEDQNLRLLWKDISSKWSIDWEFDIYPPRPTDRVYPIHYPHESKSTVKIRDDDTLLSPPTNQDHDESKRPDSFREKLGIRRH